MIQVAEFDTLRAAAHTFFRVCFGEVPQELEGEDLTLRDLCLAAAKGPVPVVVSSGYPAGLALFLESREEIQVAAQFGTGPEPIHSVTVKGHCLDVVSFLLFEHVFEVVGEDRSDAARELDTLVALEYSADKYFGVLNNRADKDPVEWHAVESLHSGNGWDITLREFGGLYVPGAPRIPASSTEQAKSILLNQIALQADSLSFSAVSFR